MQFASSVTGETLQRASLARRSYLLVMYVMYCESLMFPERSSLSRVVHRYGERFVHLETFRSLQSRFCASTAAIFRFSTSHDIVARTAVLFGIRPTKRDRLSILRSRAILRSEIFLRVRRRRRVDRVLRASRVSRKLLQERETAWKLRARPPLVFVGS